MNGEAKRRQSLGKARWLPDQGCAEIVKAKGKYMGQMGFGNYLFPEEAVFLCDRDEIELVTCEDSPLSKLESFALLDQVGMHIHAYTVYATLREQRFNVFRHGYWHTGKQHLSQLALPDVNSSAGCQPKIAFDVYQPKQGFSKNAMESPDFCLLLFPAEQVCPSISSLQMVIRQVQERDVNAAVRLCIVGDSSLQFLQVEKFELNVEQDECTQQS